MANDPDHVTGMKYLDANFRAAPKDSLVFEKFGQNGTCLLSYINEENITRAENFAASHAHNAYDCTKEHSSRSGKGLWVRGLSRYAAET